MPDSPNRSPASAGHSPQSESESTNAANVAAAANAPENQGSGAAARATAAVVVVAAFDRYNRLAVRRRESGQAGTGGRSGRGGREGRGGRGQKSEEAWTLELPFVGADIDAVRAQLAAAFGEGACTAPVLQFFAELGIESAAQAAPDSGGNDRSPNPSARKGSERQEGREGAVYFSQIETAPETGTASPSGTAMHGTAKNASGHSALEFRSIESLENAPPSTLAPALRALLAALDPHLLHIPYLHLGENDFIYKFRPEKERNVSIYANDTASSTLYQSRLCELIKRRARTREGSASEPVALDFGAIAYHIPSHFGFCLGVKNAIERAYEALAANPGRRVFMLSELIHNPFVNADLLRRGLSYLQSDKGVPFTVDGELAPTAPEGSGDGGGPHAPLRWDTLSSEDVVIIPAFGATDEDKRRLVRKGIAVYQYDATCMLVEKVWKAARNYGRKGYTVIIHGKAEHEETKATFSNTRRYAPALIVRDLEEVRQLGRLIAASAAGFKSGASGEPGSGAPNHAPSQVRDTALAESLRAEFREIFKGKYTPGFDVLRDLERVAVVNQTTLLVNETRAIIDYLRDLYATHYGAAEASERVGGSGKNDTLCYATQVNQDALARALEEPLDAAFVIGGKNSSNTYQLYRLCEKALGARAYFIQSERDILSAAEVEHLVFPYKRGALAHTERRPLWPATGENATSLGALPRKQVLITGGASCPDGLLQQVITRLNSFFPKNTLRPLDTLLEELGEQE
ncbi:hypothetical protein AXK11_07560 [Cephaloticoccus primus]|uniref:4-hydroxy-3-methylbut-2-enyl diphosphate reductase n=1 Tax=Cephaloticoccus primus TaxID=1548207 RepID=A0A139SK87_9BACT|nr:hypothetical protein [Cephaloticoccus primus]KXU34936.1 hypothetical protein AXK11_07560 [Cephaloticoccus primus]